MRTKEILAVINENGGFDNFSHWNYNEITEWVLSNFDCSKYVARNVAFKIQY